tara:strand:+ start:331 stop:498 length:168 start_codon:yes stop_codon:yes gene_type:complete
MKPAEYKRLRLKLGLNQRELAERLGLCRKTIINRETGRLPISVEAEITIRNLKTK